MKIKTDRPLLNLMYTGHHKNHRKSPRHSFELIKCLFFHGMVLEIKNKPQHDSVSSLRQGLKTFFVLKSATEFSWDFFVYMYLYPKHL